MTKPSRTLGIDLAAQASGTAACLIEWGERRPQIVPISDVIGASEHLDDRALLDLIEHESVGRVGIDCPLGWPPEFVAAIASWQEGSWPIEIDDPGQDQASLVLRATDRAVIEATERPLELGGAKRRAKRPLSVSANLIGVTAMRCARVMHELGLRLGEPVDRSGSGLVVEAYPDATLREWGLWPAHWDKPRQLSYKKAKGRSRREMLVKSMQTQGCGWLQHEPDFIDQCLKSDDKLDAMICALVARAVDKKLTQPISDQARAEIEGWIHLPRYGSLAKLQ